MTWLDKIRSARKSLADTFRKAEQDEKYPLNEEEAEIGRGLILLTEAIEEIGRHAKTPLIDRDAEHERRKLDEM
jgi:hypothetical protein